MDKTKLVAPRHVWTAARWWCVIGALSASPLFFRYAWPTASALQGYGLGWIVCAVILLARRGDQ